MLRTSLCIVVAGLALTAGRPAHADPAWRLDAASSTRWLGSTSAAALTTANLGTADFGAERAFASLAAPFDVPIELAGGVGVNFGSTSGTIFQRLGTKTSDLELVAGFHATARLRHHLALSGRATLGVARAAVAITDMYAPTVMPVDDHGWGSIASASLGAEVTPVDTRVFRLGVGIEAGYVATSAITLHAYPGDRPSTDLSIATTYAAIGTLDLGGWSMRFGVHAAF
jgi:hypothetical protein